MALLSDKFRMYAKLLRFLLPMLSHRFLQKVGATIHRLTYTAAPDAKNVVVVGGSFAGFFVAQQLVTSLPTGYRVVLVERNEHMHYVFNFPRFSVMKGKERTAFIPYTGLENMATPGAYERKHATAERLERNKLLLSGGEEIEFAYCVVATGAKQPFPARLDVTGTDAACEQLKRAQSSIKRAGKIAVVGAGAVGVEMGKWHSLQGSSTNVNVVVVVVIVADEGDSSLIQMNDVGKEEPTDIKAYYPEKTVTLVSSRDCLLPGFGVKLREHASQATRRLGIEVILNARPEICEPSQYGGMQQLVFKDGRTECFDLVIPCTGQSPNASIVSNVSPRSISSKTGRILVTPSLQLADPEMPHVFALGDVADSGGPRMGRAAFCQARVVAQNIVASIKGGALRAYRPEVVVEGLIKLTLGKTEYVVDTCDADGNELLYSASDGSEDLDIARAWELYGVHCDAEALAEKRRS
ncbi:uncharacterized protein PV09_08647 [Verruconis gallopava]|uniref:FAD/NAD(P)-binding domain-containing protein n=1 Tax=Verruconis gallopava TaxID=253628 RepID=A0A0D1ZZ56_9PEZI|nr:uncharacterized protein PV09_08647 [Verruconis gallopava]KIV99717.1 hypothetical protein PV09_08647 [Verruconis gallopava]